MYLQFQLESLTVFSSLKGIRNFVLSFWTQKFALTNRDGKYFELVSLSTLEFGFVFEVVELPEPSVLLPGNDDGRQKSTMKFGYTRNL